ncbi:MAG: SpoIVB peptidase [Defluviitaleaceae bacterium]|nr:SpoIVB peptidase [Defluviitaleaceae bacterium]
MRNRAKCVCKIFAILCVTILIGYCAGSIAFLLNFPGEIRLTEFASHKLTIGTGLPLQATFQNEAAAVAMVNNQPVCGPFTTHTRQPFTIKTDGVGTAEMTIGAFGLPIRRIVLEVVPDIKVVPLGTAIGVRINTDGVMVLGTGSFLGTCGSAHRPSDGMLQAGDLIFKVDGTDIKDKETLSQLVAKSAGDVTLYVRRDGSDMTVTLSPQTAATDGVRRIGAWVRDSTKGIGTLTYYNPATGTFGALGHGIVDVDTKKLMSVKSGVIMPSTVTSVKRGVRGVPGELEGTVDANRSLGYITANNQHGIYGVLCPKAKEAIVNREPVPIALRAHIVEGPATILTGVCGTKVREYDIVIESVNRLAADETKGMVIRMTDPELLTLTGGIVQGMSGSPILQNGRLAGAITHVFVQDPTKGYGIFIEHMMQAAQVEVDVVDV